MVLRIPPDGIPRAGGTLFWGCPKGQRCRFPLAPGTRAPEPACPPRWPSAGSGGGRGID